MLEGGKRRRCSRPRPPTHLQPLGMGTPCRAHSRTSRGKSKRLPLWATSSGAHTGAEVVAWPVGMLLASTLVGAWKGKEAEAAADRNEDDDDDAVWVQLEVVVLAAEAAGAAGVPSTSAHAAVTKLTNRERAACDPGTPGLLTSW